MTRRSATSEFLFVTWSGGGNVPPLVALGRRLLARGHRIRVIGTPDLTDRFQREGMSFIGRPWLESWTEVVIAETEREPTDLLVVDFMRPDALCAAESTGAPYVAFVHTLYQRLAVGRFTPMHMSSSVQQIIAVRAELDMPPLERMEDLLDRATRVLVTTVPEFDRPDPPVPSNVRFVGPLLEEADDDWTPPFASNEIPLVVVSMGTTSMDEAPVVQRLLDVFGDLDARIFLTIGEHLEASSFRVPPNAVVSGFVPHSAVLPHASVFVGHAGLGGISAALAFGVPVVCVPLGRDQPTNAEHVEAVGAGLTVSNDATSDELREAVRTVLADDGYARSAQRMADVISGYGNGARAVEELEALVG